MAYLPFPAPVHVGVVTSGGDNAQLHRFTLERNLSKMEKLLKTGVDVDCINHQGQTPLFCAALWGQVKATDLLLDYGADPNHRCEDRSTPVHAGVFSCNPSLVSSLLDAGGDLRLHDHEGRTPFDWLRSAPLEGRTRMEDFLQSCMFSMQQLFLSPDKTEIGRSAPYSSTSSLLQPASLLDHIIPRNKKFNKKTMSRCSSTGAFCLGFGKLCVNQTCAGVSVPASVPVIGNTDLTLSDDQPLLTFTCGPLTSLTRSSWRGSTVSVKSLRDTQTEHRDLLITELQYCSQLRHPQLLQLMAVSVSDDLLGTSLVFEPVDVGTLNNLLHIKRAEFPVLQESWILSVILQVCEGLQFLHRGALVMRALSSHSVVLTKLTVAKLTDLGFMIPSKETKCDKPPHQMPLPPRLYRWAAPEVIKQRPCREEADIYSVCALILELFTDEEPWGTVDLNRIKQAMDSSQTLAVHSCVPQPYKDMIQRGLQLEPQNRTCSLQNLKETLQQDIKQRHSVEEQPRGNPEKDPGPGVQTTTRHTTMEEPIHRGGGTTLSPVLARTNTEEERHELRVDQLDRDRYKHTGRDPMLHYSHIPRLSGESYSGSDEEEFYSGSDDEESGSGSDDEEFDSGSDDEESGSGSVHGEPETETEEQTDDLRLPTVDQHISTILVNLKVSKELLQQAHRSLDTLEKHHQLVLREQDQLDSVTTLRDAPPCIQDNISCASSFSMSSADLCGLSAAVGPPSERYSLPHQRGGYQRENLMAQLLSRDFKLLSEDELSVWMSLYPVEQHSEQSRPLPGLSSQKPDPCSEEQTWYVSAMDDSFERKQQTSSSEEDADTTEEVRRPAATGSQLQDTQNTKYQSFSRHCEETDPDAAVTANTNMTRSDMALLAELSSITCSPARPQQNFCGPSVNTPALPYNSTPHCPDSYRHVKIMKANLPESPACISFNSLKLGRFNTAKENTVKGSNSPQPAPFCVDSPYSPQTFITANLQEDTPSPLSAVQSTEKEEHRRRPEEEVETAGGAEPEQEEENGTSHKHPKAHVEEEEEEEEEQDEEDGFSCKFLQLHMEEGEEEREKEEHAKDGSDEEEDTEEQFDEEECSWNFGDEEELDNEGSGEEVFAKKCSDEEEVIVVCSDEGELFQGGSDEEKAIDVCSDEEEAVGERRDEEEAVGQRSDEEQGGVCDLQRVKSEEEDDGNRRKIVSPVFKEEAHTDVGVSLFDAEKEDTHLESHYSSLEDTNRAHSTLDEVLQELINEETTQSPEGNALGCDQAGDHGGNSTGQKNSQLE
ncbi:inactive serine/threonine-protein kinase TEX14-like [Notolabrus celidotus]|uniref:inactive serine/threonine-protein kinase TEX14-like n=1 Tax=Notolabrus celidotus TaxID=1203425 RepID=UPI00148FC614|nr:inactive serine/threonine-protein kinase TEX14-like [Notolabrus celidotus]